MAGADGIRCMLMRGGTSKGAFFLAEDVPTDATERADLMLRVMGSPDPTQIDGLGGAHPLTSKVAIVSLSEEPGIDLDYLFLQVVVDKPVVSDAQTCGNLLAAVGPFAIERGLIEARDGETPVRIRMLNTGDVASTRIRTPGGIVDYDGDFGIDGVPGLACAIELEVGGDSPLLPTGNIVDEIDGHRVTLIDNGMPVVLLDASEFGVSGDESPEDLEALSERFASFVKANPGLRIEQINKQLGTTTKDLALPIRKLIADGTLKAKGKKRSTTYFAGSKAKN